MTEARDVQSAATRLPESTQVAIVGGGIMGAASAYYLAKRGVDVVLLEKGELAGEQSGRNWGWVRQAARDVDELPLMMESNRLWRGIEEEIGENIEWTQKGILAVARDHARIEFFKEWIKIAHAAGLETSVIDDAGIKRLLPQIAGEWLGALYTPSDGHAEPALATRAFARGAQRLGAVLAEQTAVDRIVLDGTRVRGVETERGFVRAEHVVVAAGVWSARLLRPIKVDLPLRIVRSTVASTHPVAPLTEMGVGYHPVVSLRQRPNGVLYIAAGGWSDYDVTFEAFRHIRMFLPNYIKNRRLIRIHFGRPLLEDVARILRPWARDARPWRRQRVLSPPASGHKVRVSVAEFRRMFPTVEFEIASTWAGYIDSTPDAVPVIDALPEPAGLIIASGFSGHGFGMGPIVGRLVSELVCEGEPSLDLSPFRFGRFRDGSFAKPRLVG